MSGAFFLSATMSACSGRTTTVTLPEAEALRQRRADCGTGSRATFAWPLACETSLPSRKFVSPMKLATKRSAGRS